MLFKVIYIHFVIIYMLFVSIEYILFLKRFKINLSSLLKLIISVSIGYTLLKLLILHLDRYLKIRGTQFFTYMLYISCTNFELSIYKSYLSFLRNSYIINFLSIALTHYLWFFPFFAKKQSY
jgi:hypothetical protein